MPQIQFGFTIPADLLDKTQRTTYVADLNHALTLIRGHFDSAWFIDHLPIFRRCANLKNGTNLR